MQPFWLTCDEIAYPPSLVQHLSLLCNDQVENKALPSSLAWSSRARLIANCSRRQKYVSLSTALIFPFRLLRVKIKSSIAALNLSWDDFWRGAFQLQRGDACARVCAPAFECDFWEQKLQGVAGKDNFFMNSIKIWITGNAGKALLERFFYYSWDFIFCGRDFYQTPQSTFFISWIQNLASTNNFHRLHFFNGKNE